MIYIVSKQQRNKLPADGTYNIAYNLYPNEWRIRSGHLPEEEIRVV